MSAPEFNYKNLSGTSRDIVSSNKDLSAMRDSLLSKYGNSPYASLIKNNPYSFVPTLPYRASNDFWNDLYGSYEKSASEYYAQIQQLMLEQEYNSESEKVKRLREAGINPDLQGLQNASEASPFDMPMTSPELPSSFQSTETGIGLSNTILDGLQKVINVGMQFAQGMEEYKGRQYENFNLALTNKGNLYDRVVDYLAQTSGLNTDMSFEDFGNQIIAAASKVADDPTIPKRIRKAWRSQVGQLNFDKPSDWPVGLRSAYEKYRNQYATNRNSAFNIFGNGLFSGDDEKFLANVFETMGKPFKEITDLKNEYNIQYLKNEKEYVEQLAKLGAPRARANAESVAIDSSREQSEYNRSYYDHANDLGVPGVSAQAALESAYVTKQKALYDQMMLRIMNASRRFQSDLTDLLNGAADHGSWLARLYLSQLPQLMESLDNFTSWIIPSPDHALQVVSGLGRAGLL